MQDQTLIYTAFALYLAAVMVLGYLAYRRTSGFADYVLGGRRLPGWIAALSAGASDMSGWLLLGLPGYAYSSGLEALWLVAGLAIGVYLSWRIMARRLRIYTELAGNSLTIPDFLRNRFLDQSRTLARIASAFILLFYAFYTSAGLVAGAKLFNTVFAIPYHTALLVGATIIVSYTLIGGFLAVSWTDVIQGLLMALALVVMPMVAIEAIGGWDSTLNSLRQTKPQWLDPFTSTGGESITWITAVSLMGWGLGYFGQPHILARFKAVRSANEIGTARRVATTWTLLCLGAALMVGLIGTVAMPGSDIVADPEKIFLLLIQQYFHPLVAGFLLAAVLAAVMSTADSQLLVSSATFTNDIYKRGDSASADDSTMVGVGRAAVVAIALVAIALAWNPDNTVLGLVAYAWGGFGAAFGPVLLLGLFWRRLTRSGAIAGIICGGATVIMWKQLDQGIFALYELVPGFVAGGLAAGAVSIFTKPPSQNALRLFDEARAASIDR